MSEPLSDTEMDDLATAVRDGTAMARFNPAEAVATLRFLETIGCRLGREKRKPETLLGFKPASKPRAKRKTAK